MEICCFYFCILPPVWGGGGGEIPGKCVGHKWQCNVKHKLNRLLEKTVMVLPIGCLRSDGPLAGICWTESQSPRYSPGLGAMVHKVLIRFK